MTMKVLLFGGNGFLGKELKALLDKNHIENFTASRSGKDSDYKVDIGNFEDFKILPYDFFTVVVNCASVLPGGDYLDADYLNQTYSTNILGSQNICNWIKNQKSIIKVINCSTLVVVQKPWIIPLTEENGTTYPFGKHVLYCSSKLTQELIFKTFANDSKINLVQIRFSALYGQQMKWNGLICSLIDQAKNNKSICITNGTKISADFLHIEDAARIVWATIINPINGIINGATGIECTIMDIAKAIQQNFESFITLENIENEMQLIDRSLVSVQKLKTIIATESFLSISEGIKRMML